MRLVLFLCFLAPSLMAQTYSLQQALEQAINQHLTLKAAQTNVQIAKNNNNYGEAGRYPTVTANLNSPHSFSNINNPTSFLNGAKLLSTGLTPSLDMTWTLYNGHQVRIQKERLEVLENQSQESLNAETETVVLAVMQAYYQALVQQRRLEMLERLLNLSRQKIEYTDARREYGQATEFDRLQVLDAYLSDSIQWILQRNNYELSLQTLALSMGMPPETDINAWALSDTLAYEQPSYEFEALSEELRSSNRQLRNLRITEELAALDWRLQKTQLGPKLSMTGSVSDQLTLMKVNRASQSTDWTQGSTLAMSVGFSLSYVLYNGGRLRRAVQNANLRQDIARTQRTEAERQLLHQLKIQLMRYDNQRQALALSQSLLANAERNLTIATERFETGILNFFDYRTVQINYLRSQNSLQDAFLNAKNAELELWRSLGRLIQR